MRNDLPAIQEAIRTGRIRVTDHADEELHAEKLSIDILLDIVLNNGELIEEYVSNEFYPRSLIYGETFNGDPIHSVWGYNSSNGWAVLITVYWPDPDNWIDGRRRK